MSARADFLITRLTDAGCTLQAKRGRIVVTPPAGFSSPAYLREIREQVAALKDELQESLARWPNATAPARDFNLFPRRHDELARRAPELPRAIKRLTWRR